MSERRFTDEEVAIILRDATETAGGARRERDAGDLTLRQLEEIAGEVGLDPVQVRSAAGRLVLHRSGQRLPFLGTPVAPAFERVIPGALPPGDLAEVVTTIRRVLGRRGIASSELVPSSGGPRAPWAGATCR
ncbi:MAG: thioredoxin domain-containing protein [Longimicrobiales bacterium]